MTTEPRLNRLAVLVLILSAGVAGFDLARGTTLKHCRHVAAPLSHTIHANQ